MNKDKPIIRQSILNLRDLGGLQTQDRAKIKSARLYRSANPSWAEEQDINFLKKLDLAYVVDFRSEPEKNLQKEALFDRQFPKIVNPVALGDLISDTVLKQMKEMTQEDVSAFMCHLYTLFVTDFQPHFGRFMKLLEQGKPVLYHCTAGKDRTGFASLLLLSALGVDQETIMDNYLESNLYTQSIFEKSDDHARQLGMDMAVYKLFQIVSPDYLNAAINTIDKEFGGIDTYITKTLAVDIDKIRQNYLV